MSFPNRFLLYFDKAWDCWFFFSFPTSDYQHSLYYVQIDNYPEVLKQPSFVIDGIEYRWMTIEEMELDPVIREINGDVVSYVK